MTNTILCVGALTMDTIFRLEELPTRSGKFIPLEAVEVAEGMASAQAASIVRLGGVARLWASAGDDTTGDRLISQLSAQGVDCASVRRARGARSGFSSIFMDLTGERIIVPHYDVALRATPDSLPPMDDVALVSTDARWPDAAEMALSEAKKRGIPGLLDADVASYEILARLAPLASHIVASEPGAAVLTGVDDPTKAILLLAQRYEGFVAITAGERGCFWFHRDTGQVRHAPAPKVRAIDTLAAGDVFHAAFAQGLLEKLETETLIRRASAAAAIKCTRFGGRLGAPTKQELDAFLAEVEF